MELHDVIVCNGPPKCGNHALVKACELLGLPASVNHIGYRDGMPDGRAKHLFIKRDPRDAVVSMLRFMGEQVTSGTFITCFRRFLDRRSLVDEFARFEPWFTDPYTLVVRYEDLIASDAEMRRIATFVGVPYLDDAFVNLPGYTKTWNDVRSDYRSVWNGAVAEVWAGEGGNELMTRWGY